MIFFADKNSTISIEIVSYINPRVIPTSEGGVSDELRISDTELLRYSRNIILAEIGLPGKSA